MRGGDKQSAAATWERPVTAAERSLCLDWRSNRDNVYDVADAPTAGGGFVPADLLARWRTLGTEAATDTASALRSESEQVRDSVNGVRKSFVYDADTTDVAEALGRVQVKWILKGGSPTPDGRLRAVTVAGRHVTCGYEGDVVRRR